MKLKASKIRVQYNEQMESEIILTTKDYIKNEIEELKNVILNGKELTVEIKQYRHKRSIDSNAYMWLLLNKMASILNTTKDEVYLQELSRYGIYTHVVVKGNVVARVKAEWRTVIELGKVNINGKEGIQLQCYFGSSTYNSKEMSTLINGVVQDAKELGINTVTNKELELMSSAWGIK